jgi:hypothetical protein
MKTSLRPNALKAAAAALLLTAGPALIGPAAHAHGQRSVGPVIVHGKTVIVHGKDAYHLQFFGGQGRSVRTQSSTNQPWDVREYDPQGRLVRRSFMPADPRRPGTSAAPTRGAGTPAKA